MIKRIIALFMVLVICGTCAITAFAESGTVTASALNVRSGAGSTYKVIGTLKRNTSVEVHSRSGNWYEITYQNQLAFVCADYIKLTQSTSTSTSNNGTLTVVNSYANLRSGAGASYKYLGRAYAKEAYAVLGSGKASNGRLWYKIKYKGGEAWICSSFVRMSGSGNTQSVPKPAPTPSTSGTAIKLSEADKRYIASVVSAEARGESYRGQLAVAQCIYDRTINPNWPSTAIAVVKQKSQFAKPWSGGKYTQSCYNAVVDVFDKGVRVTDCQINYFCLTSCYPSWRKTTTYVTTIGNHVFYRR